MTAVKKLVTNGFVLVFLLMAICFHGGEQRSASQGGWGEWGSVSACSSTCGMGLMTRVRQWVPADGEPDLEVPFTNTEEFTCYQAACPQNGSWSMWGIWGECSVGCGPAGVQQRHRDCNSPPPENGGANCSGDAYQNVPCDTSSPCPEIPRSFNVSVCEDKESYYLCGKQQMCVPVAQVCDGSVHCNDGTDEVGCWRKNSKLGHIRFNSHASSASFSNPIDFVVTTIVISLVTLLL